MSCWPKQVTAGALLVTSRSRHFCKHSNCVLGDGNDPILLEHHVLPQSCLCAANESILLEQDHGPQTPRDHVDNCIEMSGYMLIHVCVL